MTWFIAGGVRSTLAKLACQVVTRLTRGSELLVRVQLCPLNRIFFGYPQCYLNISINHIHHIMLFNFLLIVALLNIAVWIVDKISLNRFYHDLERRGGVQELDCRINEYEIYLKENDIYDERDWDWLDLLKDIRDQFVKRQKKVCIGGK